METLSLDYVQAQFESWRITEDDAAPRYGRDAQGYGLKIPTRYWLHITPRKGKKYKRRIYAICISNSASYFVMWGGRRVFLHPEDMETGYHATISGNRHQFTAPDGTGWII